MMIENSRNREKITLVRHFFFSEAARKLRVITINIDVAANAYCQMISSGWFTHATDDPAEIVTIVKISVDFVIIVELKFIQFNISYYKERILKFIFLPIA